MKPTDPVTTLMSANPVHITTDRKLSEARKTMHDHSIHHLPVVESGRFVGLLSSNDLLRVGFGDVYKQDERTIDALLDTSTIREVMQEDVLTIQKDETVRRAAEHLHEGEFHSLPVLDGETLVGLVTSTDLIGALLELWSQP